ncbi:MAG: response regulator transcription factor [Turicibacter sp.]
MRQYKVLVVEDDWEINGLLCGLLGKNGYEVKAAYSGTEAKMVLSQEIFDLVLLDLMLPGMSGQDLIQDIRKEQWMPVIIMSAKVTPEDKIQLLKLGADDYISKPFDIYEVLARVEAQIRRSQLFSKSEISSCELTFKNIVLNKEAKDVKVRQEQLTLTSREFAILELMMGHPQKVFTRANIFESIWGNDYLGDDNTVNVHVSNLRTKLSKIDPGVEYIQTVWGIGFKLKE